MQGGIEELINSMLGGRTLKQLSKDCGGTPTIGRISGIMTDGVRGFPTLTTINGLAKGLGVSPQTVIQACGVTLGLWTVENFSAGALQLPLGAEKLTKGQKNAVVSVVREFINANAA